MNAKEQLPDFVLAELYGKSLVVINEKINVNQPKENVNKKNFYLGNYEKKIIVLINDTDNIYLSDENLDFLTGILNACKLNLAHIALINFNNNVLKFAELKKKLQPSCLVSFGIDALKIELPFTMPNYQVQQYDNCQILIAPSLNELNTASATAVTEKKKLWKSLQKMFSLEK